MTKYTVLKLGDKTEFEIEQFKIDKLISTGYKIVCEIEAGSIGDARYKYDNKDSNQQNTNSGNAELRNPSGYLNVTSTLFLVLSVIGCFVLIALGVNAGDSYETRRYSGVYYASAFACLVLTLLIHSVCRVLIFISNRET